MVVASIVGRLAVLRCSIVSRPRAGRGEGEWDFADAAMEGSSWFGLPRVLHWLTGNIGFHHVHHLNPRVPNYRLGAAHEAVQALWPVKPLSLAGGLARAVVHLVGRGERPAGELPRGQPLAS